jgi:hypothetical protein
VAVAVARGVAVAGWQWYRWIEEVGAVILVPEWQWQWLRGSFTVGKGQCGHFGTKKHMHQTGYFLVKTIHM